VRKKGAFSRNSPTYCFGRASCEAEGVFQRASERAQENKTQVQRPFSGSRKWENTGMTEVEGKIPLGAARKVVLEISGSSSAWRG